MNEDFERSANAGELQMNRVIVGSNTIRELGGLSEHSVFCDEAGKELGQFLPNDAHADFLNAGLEIESGLSEHELAERLQEPGGRSLAEIWRSLDGR